LARANRRGGIERITPFLQRQEPINSPSTENLAPDRARRLARATLCAFSHRLPERGADEAELSKYYENVDVWHFPVDYSVAYNNQDVIVPAILWPCQRRRQVVLQSI